MEVDMRTPPDSGIPVKWYGVRRAYWLAAVLFLLFAVAIRMAPSKRPFADPKIEAPAYVWPAGCAKKKYRVLSKIDKSCLDPKYYIGDGRKFGWKRISQKPYYYRVGNDAVMVTDIAIGEDLSQNLTVYEVIDDVFAQKGAQ